MVFFFKCEKNIDFIGTRLLNKAFEIQKQLCKDATEIYLHVHTQNEGAISFYKKFGFEHIGQVENYYTGISPPDAIILSKKL